MQTVKIDNIEVFVSKKAIKKIYLKIRHLDKKVFLSVPLRTPNNFILKFLESKKDWIHTKLKECINNENFIKNESYEDNSTHYLWGMAYTLDVVVNSYRTDIFVDGQKIVMQIAKNADVDRAKLLQKLYKKELDSVLPKIVEHCENIVGVKCNEFHIKNMKTRWGSCNVLKKRIWLNLQLAKKPPKCLSYVVTHELVHLLEASHNARFHALMDKFYPNWRLVKDDLNSQNYG